MRAKGFIYFIAAGVFTVAAVWSVLFSLNPTKNMVVNDLAENSGEKPAFEISSECGAAVIAESAGSPVREARNALDAPSDPHFSLFMSKEELTQQTLPMGIFRDATDNDRRNLTRRP
jgi:hypothetical protein